MDNESLGLLFRLCLWTELLETRKKFHEILGEGKNKNSPLFGVIFSFCLAWCREKYLHISFWRAFSLYLTSAADLNSLVLLPGGLLWMPY